MTEWDTIESSTDYALPSDMEEVTVFSPDPLKMLTETQIGVEGMKVDPKLFEKFGEVVRADTYIKEKYEAGDVKAVEEYVRKEIFDKPEEYINLDKLRKALKIDRRVSLSEVIDSIFQGVRIKTKEELLDDEFEKFISIYKPESRYVPYINNFLKAYITDSEVRDIVESKEYSRFATNPQISIADIKALNGWRDTIPEYVKDYVPLNTFM